MDNSNSPKASILKETREQKGLTLDIVHEATKIPMDALKAIEEGYSVRILSPFYYRGFVKIYAEFLGVDVEEAWRQYGIDAKAKAAAVKAPPVKQVKPNYALGQTQELMATILSPKNRQVIVRVVAFVIALFVLVKIGGCVVNHIKAMPKHKKVAEQSKPKKQVPAAHKEEAAIEEKTVPVAPPVQSLSNNRGVELAVRAARDSWIQVKADDKVVFQMTMKKGTMETWSAKDHIELSGRNINELEMEVNGKHIGALGSSERRAKRVVITKEGLTVKK